MEDFAEHDFCEVFRRIRGRGLQNGCRTAEGPEGRTGSQAERKTGSGRGGGPEMVVLLLVELLVELAIMARQLLRQGRRLAFPLRRAARPHPVPPGYRGVELSRGPGSWQGLRARAAPTA